ATLEDLKELEKLIIEGKINQKGMIKDK
ncbi:hypothetical protein A7N74_14880, partial [Listeria monocytogenes]